MNLIILNIIISTYLMDFCALFKATLTYAKSEIALKYLTKRI